MLLTAWFAAASGWRPLATVLAAAAVHELGHLAVLRLLGGRAMGLYLSALGAVLEVDSARLSYGGELAAVLAGPGANLLCAAALAALEGEYHAFIGANMVLCVFNLLPIRPLDGGRALELLVSWLAGPGTGDFAAQWVGSACAVGLGAFLTWLMYRAGGNLWLIPPVVGLVRWALPGAVRVGGS